MKHRLNIRPGFWLPAVLFMATLLPAIAAEEGADDAAAPLTLLQIILHGGPLIILIWISILATSVTMVTFIIKLSLSLQKNRLAPPALLEALKNLVGAGNYQEAWANCEANDNYMANVLRTGLERLGRGKEAVEDGISEASLREAQLLRSQNSYLSVIGVVSPMIGLLGTVIGMMGAFGKLGASGIGDPRGLAQSIGEVLAATASGLFIAIPAFIAYYVFRNRSQICIVHADDKINELLMDIPFAELEGIKIGENFSAGGGAPVAGASQSRRVSMSLTTNCPVCNGAVTAGQNPCPHCGATLQWAQ